MKLYLTHFFWINFHDVYFLFSFAVFESNLIVVENYSFFNVIINIIPIGPLIATSILWVVIIVTTIMIVNDMDWYFSLLLFIYVAVKFHKYYSLVSLLLQNIYILRKEIRLLATNFDAPKTELICIKKIPEKYIHFYIGFHRSTFTHEWISLQYHYLVILHPFHMTYCRRYGQGIKSQKK